MKRRVGRTSLPAQKFPCTCARRPGNGVAPYRQTGTDEGTHSEYSGGNALTTPQEHTGAPRSFFARDVLSSVLFLGPLAGLWELLAFIATKRLDAGLGWVGVIGSAGYLGYLWNLFFARFTARVSLRRSIVAIMCVSGLLLWAAGLQRRAVPYCLLVILFLAVVCLFDVQYNTLVRHLYGAAERPRRLSHRQLIVALAGSVLAAGFGIVSARRHGHLPAFFAAGLMMMLAAGVFRGMAVDGEPGMERFGVGDVIRTVWHDRRFRRVALVLIVYGWVGAGTGTLLAILYKHLGFNEAQVGWLAATGKAGALLAYVAITPFLRFHGGVTNYRLCYSTAAISIALIMVVGFADVGTAAFAILVPANMVFGISAAGFLLATQTTAINLAPQDKTTVYVNSLMIVQGARGILAPLLVAAVLQWFSLHAALIVSASVVAVCVGIAWIPGIDGRSE